MDVELEETGPIERKLSIEIPTAEVDAAFGAVYKRLQKAAKIPGFRPGKVPESVVQRYFGDQARAEAMESLVQTSLAQAIQERELAPITEPRLSAPEPPKEGAPYRYEVTIDIRPDIELKKVRGLELAAPELPEPKEDPVTQHLESLQKYHAQLVDEEPEVPAAAGHQAVINYDATVDGDPFEGGSAEETLVELGESRAIPGLEEQLEGMRAGEEKTFELTLPEQFPIEDVAGKQAEFAIKLVALKRRELPDLDDEFAKDVSEEFETLDALKADLQKRIDEGRERDRKEALRQGAVEAVIEANPFPIPESLVDRQLQQRIAQAAQQLQQLPGEDLGKMVEGWRAEWRPAAERDVRMAFLIPEIAKAEKLEAGDEAVDAQLERLAEQSGQPVAQVRSIYQEQGLLDSLRNRALEEQVVDFLVQEASVSGS